MDILKNATITYSDGIEEKFDAIRITDKGIILIRIIDENGDKKFVDYGYISKDSIKTIIDGNNRKINII